MTRPKRVRSPAEGSSGYQSALNVLTVAEWLDSRCLPRLASRVAYLYGLTSQDVPDLLQELCLALWKAGPDLTVNATWIFRTASHKAVDFLKRRVRVAEEMGGSTESLYSESGADSSLLLLLRARAARLPKKLHDFYSLRYQDGLSQREMAERLGVCRSSVQYLERRCLRMMK